MTTRTGTVPVFRLLTSRTARLSGSLQDTVMDRRADENPHVCSTDTYSDHGEVHATAQRPVGDTESSTKKHKRREHEANVGANTGAKRRRKKTGTASVQVFLIFC